MTELTPERIREAANVIGELFASGRIATCSDFGELTLLDAADRLERERAAEAKRQERHRELVDLMRGVPGVYMKDLIRVVDLLLDRYPALLEDSDA